MRGRLHNIYVTPDQKYVVIGSVAKKFVSVVDHHDRYGRPGPTSSISAFAR